MRGAAPLPAALVCRGIKRNDQQPANDSRADGKAQAVGEGRLRARRAFGSNLTRAESNLRIAMLKAKLKRNGSRRCGFRS
jgi:hypothetical protein